METEGRAAERHKMVERQIVGRGVRAPLVLKAMTAVPRELFVPEALANSAYLDGPLPIGQEQTISQPYIVALMAEALELKGGERVLEIGAGSGYAAAVLGQIANEVIAIERVPALAELAVRNVARAGCSNVHVLCRDGTLGWPSQAPYDAILVSAGAPEVPETFKRQLAPGGRLVLPVGRSRTAQHLLRITRTDADRFETTDLGSVHFVPLIGEAGWREAP